MAYYIPTLRKSGGTGPLPSCAHEMYHSEEITCNIFGTLRRPPCPPLYGPGVALCDKVRSCEICRALNLEPLVQIVTSHSQLGYISLANFVVKCEGDSLV